MITTIDIIVSILTLITLGSGLYFAIRRFGLKRERFTFLALNINANMIKEKGDLSLVSVIVSLENKGQTRMRGDVGSKTTYERVKSPFDSCYVLKRSMG